MFESIGFSEMLLIAVIALIVLGPEKFPEYAKIFLRATRDLQSYIQGIREDLAKEVNPLKKEFDKLGRQDPEKLLDALMKTGDKEEKKEEEGEKKNDGSDELVAGSEYTPEPAQSDSNPYAEGAGVESSPAETPAENAPEGGAPEESKRAAGKDTAVDAKEEFHYNPPEQMD